MSCCVISRSYPQETKHLYSLTIRAERSKQVRCAALSLEGRKQEQEYNLIHGLYLKPTCCIGVTKDDEFDPHLHAKWIVRRSCKR